MPAYLRADFCSKYINSSDILPKPYHVLSVHILFCTQNYYFTYKLSCLILIIFKLFACGHLKSIVESAKIA